jgi:hypothetical protein
MILKIPFHMLPLIGVVLGRPKLVVALVLLVALPYIKVKKLSVQLDDVKTHDDPHKDQVIAKISSTRDFWKKLTFMN